MGYIITVCVVHAITYIRSQNFTGSFIDTCGSIRHVHVGIEQIKVTQIIFVNVPVFIRVEVKCFEICGTLLQ